MNKNTENALFILDCFSQCVKSCLLVSGAALCVIPGFLLGKTSVSKLPPYLFIEAIAAAGPTSTKLLQWMGSRGDMFSEKLRRYAIKFQAHAPSDPFPLIWLSVCEVAQKQAKNVVYISPMTLGSGSVAQVHPVFLAKTNWLGRRKYVEAVMKVIKTNVAKHIDLDLAFLKSIASCISSLSGDTSEWFPLNQIVNQFAEFLLPQTNMIIEAQNLRVFASNFNRWRSNTLLRLAGGRVVIPRVFDELVSSEVLTESFETGIPMDKWLSDVTKLDFEKTRRSFANFGCQMFLQMLLLDNFVHCDLHPGNILVRIWRIPRLMEPRPTLSKYMWKLTSRVCRWRPDFDVVILDGGLVSRLTQADRVNFIHLFKALTFGEGYQAGRLLVERSKKHDCTDLHEFCTQVSRIVEGLIGPPIRMRDWIVKRTHYIQHGGESERGSVRMTLRDMKIGDAMRQIVSLCMRHRVQLEPAFLGVILAMGIVEGLGIQLDPTMDLISASRPYLGVIARDAMLKYEQVWWNNTSADKVVS